MLNNRKVLARLMALLGNIDPTIPLPRDLENYLWENMKAEPFCFKVRNLETKGTEPLNAYYVVRGFVIVYGFDGSQNRYVMRIYRENTIVALNCFMKQKGSEYTIVACMGTLVWSISIGHMKQIYTDMPGMEQLTLKTALEYGTVKEDSRARLLAMDIEDRIIQFYKRYPGLLPPRKSPIKDACIASFLGTTKGILKRIRQKLKNAGLLEY